MKKNNLKLYIFVIISYCYVINAEIGCQDEDGSSVDWWAAIKYPDGTLYRTLTDKKIKSLYKDYKVTDIKTGIINTIDFFLDKKIT